MAYYRRYFRRRYRRQFRRYRSVKATNQYFRIRVDNVYAIKFPQNEAGQPGFVVNNNLEHKLTVNNILANSNYYNEVKSLWGYSKLTGVSYMCIPAPGVYGSTQPAIALVVGFVPGQATVENYNALIQNDNSLLLSPLNVVKKYVTVKGSNWWYSSFDEGGTGSFQVYCSDNIANSSKLSFTIKFSIYLTLSKSNM